MFIVKGRFGLDRKTETAGTAIVHCIPPSLRGGKAIITNIDYVAAATAHTLTIFKAIAKTTTTAAAAASQAVVALTAKTFRGDTLAANDFVVIQHTDGTFGVYVVSSVSGLNVTMTGNVSAISANAPVWIMGAVGEAEHVQILTIASVRNNYASAFAGIAQSGFYTSNADGYNRSGIDDPLLVHSNNATNAGFLENVSGYYANA
jgi:hypothetical protein